jgi:hemolysin III
LRRFDHINIFLIIAGTNTPIAVATLPEFYRNFLLGIVWGGALILLLIHMFWLNAPRALLVSMYIAVGVAPILFVIPLLEYAGVLVTVMVMAGGVFYITGGIIYARKKPNLSPEWFGFHELFHTMTVLGYACHMVAIFAAVLG